MFDRKKSSGAWGSCENPPRQAAYLRDGDRQPGEVRGSSGVVIYDEGGVTRLTNRRNASPLVSVSRLGQGRPYR